MTEKVLRCPRCGTVTPVSAGQCSQCGLKMVRKKKPDAPPAAPPATAAAPEPAAPEPAARRTAERPAQSAPAAKASVRKDTTSMPKLKLEGIERHDEGARQARDPKVKRVSGLESSQHKSAPAKSGGQDKAGDEFRSLLMEPHEVDGHEVDQSSAPVANEASELQSLMMAPHETFGDQDQDAPAPAKAGESLAEKFGFKPLYDIKDDSSVAAGPAGPGSSYDTTGLANTIPSAGGLAGRMIPQAPFEDPYGMGAGGDFQQGPETLRHPGKPKRPDDGPPPDVVVHQLRKKRAVRRLFTRVLPLALLCAATWYGGRVYGLPLLLVQGTFRGALVDESGHEVKIDMQLKRKGRSLSGTAMFDYPRTPQGLIDPVETPQIFRDIFVSEDATVIGEFDTNTVLLKFYQEDPDHYIILQGGYKFDDDHQMVAHGRAQSSEEHSADFMLYRVAAQ